MMNMSTGTQKGLALESFGARLKRERERQSMTLDSVAAATKIGTRLLQALEEEKFDRLPGGIFNKGFVRAYARHLGLDEEQAIADYLVAAGGPAPTKEPEAVVAAIAARKVESRAEKRTASSGGFPWGKITILLLVLAVGLALWSSRSQKNDRKAPPPPIIPAASVSIPASVAQPLAVVEKPPEAPSSIPSPVQIEKPDASGSFSVLIQAREDSWLSARVDGKETSSQLLPAHAEKSITAHESLMIKAGNAGGLDFSFNGKRLPAQGSQDEVKILTFDPSGLKSSAAKVGQAAIPNPPKP